MLKGNLTVAVWRRGAIFYKMVLLEPATFGSLDNECVIQKTHEPVNVQKETSCGLDP